MSPAYQPEPSPKIEQLERLYDKVRDEDKPRAIRWLAPRELLRSLFRLVVSKLFGEYADKREIIGLIDPAKGKGPELPRPTTADTEAVAATSLGIDFVSDTGDGFAATYTVAEALAARRLEVRTRGDGSKSVNLPRGRVLLHGGDLVYPTASVKEYERRFIAPYEAAGPEPEPSDPYTDRPSLYALPGNHDWYDGLISFLRLFCSGDDSLGQWRMNQTRSYWAIDTGLKWWIWGIDIQFDGLIDTPQLGYFQDRRHEVKAGESIILVTAMPSWVKQPPADSSRPTKAMTNLDYFVDTCVPDGAELRMVLSGDVHHYSRYRDDDNDIDYVIAGGGGAYLSPTHHLADEVNLLAADGDEDNDRRLALANEGELVAVYPDQKASRRLRRRAWRIPILNPSLTLTLGLIYLIIQFLTASSFRQSVFNHINQGADPSLDTFRQRLTSAADLALGSVGDWAAALTLAVLLSIFAGLRLSFTKQDLPAWEWNLGSIILGVGHTLAHYVTVLVLLATASTLFASSLAQTFGSIGAVGFLFVASAIVGSLVLSTYLFIADLMGHNDNELFAGIRHEGYKNFLRMTMTEDKVEVHVIGFDSVPPAKAWRRGDDGRWESDQVRNPWLVDTFTVTREPHKTHDAMVIALPDSGDKKEDGRGPEDPDRHSYNYA